MMTREMMIQMIEALGADADYDVDDDDACIGVTIRDWEGFDDDWESIYRDYDNPKAVDEFEDMLEAEALSIEGDLYKEYFFEGFSVYLGYDSFNE